MSPSSNNRNAMKSEVALTGTSRVKNLIPRILTEIFKIMVVFLVIAYQNHMAFTHIILYGFDRLRPRITPLLKKFLSLSGVKFLTLLVPLREQAHEMVYRNLKYDTV